MRNLVSVKPERVTLHIGEKKYLQFCGCLRSPRNNSYIQTLCEAQHVWACDNDCFTGYRPDRIRNFLERFREYAPYCRFFNCPDVVEHRDGIDYGNASATLSRFDEWEPVLRGLGWRVAFTLQDGMERYSVPWERMDALFIGASDNWRIRSHHAYVREQIAEARSRGLWVHVGRVNTINKIQLWRLAGVCSFDGTKYTREPVNVKLHLPFHSSSFSQMELFAA